MKTCTRCGAEQPLSMFNKSSRAKDGRRHECRSCQCELAAAYRQKTNGCKVKLRAELFRSDSHKECSQCHEITPLEGFWANRDMSDGLLARCIECTKQRERKPLEGDAKEKARVRKREWYEQNKQSVIDGVKKWQESNIERVRENGRVSAKRRYHENPERSRALKRKYESARRARKKGAMVDEFVDPQALHERDGGICYLCCRPVSLGNSHLDHVVPLSKGGTHSYDNMAVVHPKCNMRKHDKIVEPGCYEE